MTPRRRATAGFTLLEVMIAMAILAFALVAIMDGQGSAIVATRKARTLEAATLLAREKMESLSLEVERTGFTDEAETNCDEGTFAERGRDDVRWKACVIKVEMNVNVSDVGALASALTGGTGSGEDAESGDSSGGGAAGGGDALAALGLDPTTLTFALELLPTVTESLAQAIRRLELTVSWTEVGLGEQSFRLVLYITDPSRASLGLPGMGAIPGAGAPGTGAGTGTGVGTGTGTGTGAGTGTGTGIGSRPATPTPGGRR
ncbi:MAG TPA: type II secretion system protein [Myxococcota bacterium]|jgi:prepilin-type N-terminal cleavage/methylation domain-containing protein|nr:type II secretion system protein [Myxococcota bacterium]